MRLLAKKKLSPIVEISHWYKTDEEARYKESQHILYLNSKGHPLANGRRISCRRAREDGKWRRMRTAHLKPTKKRRKSKILAAALIGGEVLLMAAKTEQGRGTVTAPELALPSRPTKA
jgi:hypothetical protein